MISLKKIFKKNFFPFIYSSTIIGSAFFGYFAYKIKRNNANFVRNQENDNFKDTTRLSYDFYGINWGVASDNMVL